MQSKKLTGVSLCQMALGRLADTVATFDIRGSRRNLDILTTRVVDAMLEEMGRYE